jgi:para-aminobenzoate synthetase / 4-amino-4-deoxychorismate lyase
VTEDVFLLFEDTKKTQQSFSFSKPRARVFATSLEEVLPALSAIEQWQTQGYYVAGYISYEAGWALMPKRPSELKLAEHPLLDFYVFKEKTLSIEKEGDASKASIYHFQQNLTTNDYHSKIEEIFTQLRLGNTYQVNFTQRMNFSSTGDAWSTYQTLRREQRVEYSAFFDIPGLQILSFSPELFLKKTGTHLFTRPMKGTISRDADPLKDSQNKEFLATDLKNRAENVMIVDLLRNDMGKMAVPGSVHVNRLFAVEDYETVYQMVSDIECELNPDVGFKTIFENLFPCGSITGAPKLKTMEIISQLESEPRGVYTGAIGYLEPNGDFCFNVAIRTLVKEADKPYCLGVGGGILIDSKADEEYQEAQLKSRFVKRANSDFYLFETLRFEKEQFKNLQEHLERLKKSAQVFAFEFSEEAIRHKLESISGVEPRRVRLSLWSHGKLEVESFAIEPLAPHPEVVISETLIQAKNIFQHHKTSRRSLYDDQYQKARSQGFYDIIFLNEKGELVEASRHNLFIQKQGQWLTPPLAAGALAGIERGHALKDMPAREETLTVKDLKEASEIILTNSVRGRVSVRLGKGL